MTRDEFIDKIDSEYNIFLGQRFSPDRPENFEEIYDAKSQFRAILYSSPMKEDLLQALADKHNLLDEIYQTWAKTDSGNMAIGKYDYYDFVNEYIEKEEYQFLSQKLYDMANTEHEARLAEIRQMSIDKIIEKAYEIVLMDDILQSFEECHFLSNPQIKALTSLEKPLRYVYDEWLDNDFSHMEDIRTTIEMTADEIASEIQSESFTIDNSCVSESEPEL